MKPKLSEREFMAQVLQLAKMHQWRVAHFRAGMNQRGRWMTAVQADGAGFPDLLLLRGGARMVVELKVGKNKTSPEQDEWLRAFNAASVPAFVWTPNDWQIIERVLEQGPGVFGL